MPYIDFGGGSTQTPVKETFKLFDCNNCIHKCKISNDLFICTINGTFEFNDIKRKENCIYKNVISNEAEISKANVEKNAANEKLNNSARAEEMARNTLA